MMIDNIEYCSILCRFVSALKYSDLPDCVIERTKMFIADYYASCYAGMKINTHFNEAISSVVRSQYRIGNASILGEKDKYSVTAAAFMNSVYAHGADMDDGNRKSAGHIGAHVMSAIFALAETTATQWKDVIVAIIVGYEFFNRIAGAAQPGLYNKGFHSTGVGGSVACAAACAKLLRLNEDGIYNAVSLAAVQASGLIIIDESGQDCKPINAANAARCGVISAMLAQKGIKAPKKPLESRKGWFNAFSNAINQEVLLGELGHIYTISESYMKLYPSCRHTHSSIDAAKSIRDLIMKASYDFSDIKSVTIYIYPSAITSAGSIRYPKSSAEAKFSIHYTVATALLNGRFGLDDLKPKYSTLIRKLIENTILVVEESMENRAKGLRGSRVCVSMNDGRVFECYVPLPKGEGDSELSWDDIILKTTMCSQGILSDNQAFELVQKCRLISPQGLFEILFAC